MSVSLLEIVDCGDGEFILKRAEDDGDPLVTITFSEEARDYLANGGLDIARVMIHAGFQAAALKTEQVETQPAPTAPRILH